MHLRFALTCFALSLFAAGCGLLLDTSPKDEPDAGAGGGVGGGAGGGTGGGDGGLRCMAHGDCDDGIACTTDKCEPGSVYADEETGCVSVANDAACTGLGQCLLGVCLPEIGCELVADPAACGVEQTCNLTSGQCEPLATGKICTSAEDCDDGNPCNGVELCDGTCYPGTPVVCPDPVDACLDAYCDPLDLDGDPCEERVVPCPM